MLPQTVASLVKMIIEGIRKPVKDASSRDYDP